MPSFLFFHTLSSLLISFFGVQWMIFNSEKKKEEEKTILNTSTNVIQWHIVTSSNGCKASNEKMIEKKKRRRRKKMCEWIWLLKLIEEFKYKCGNLECFFFEFEIVIGVLKTPT